MKRSGTYLALIVVAVLAASGAAYAQGPAGPPGPGFHRGGPMEFGRLEMGLDRKTVTGAPYSAQVSIQTSNTLGDGTHVNRQSTGAVYRDSQGRVRREMTLPALAALTGSAQAPHAVILRDPVAGYSYVLRDSAKTAVRMPLMAGRGGKGPHAKGAVTPGGAGAQGDLAVGTGAGGPGGRLHAQVTKVSLGTQMIEGVQAEGERITRIIPAGAFGNDKATQIVVERWYSPELQTVVMMKRSDPWMGQSTYQLTNITRTEPAAALFAVPAEYTVQDRPAPRAFGPRGGGAARTPQQ